MSAPADSMLLIQHQFFLKTFAGRKPLPRLRSHPDRPMQCLIFLLFLIISWFFVIQEHAQFLFYTPFLFFFFFSPLTFFLPFFLPPPPPPQKKNKNQTGCRPARQHNSPTV